jgi:mannose/fructose/N-acetylgalactosamine-specific phosphotransferase system component IIB
MIVLTRIDDRLIHGQVATQWVTTTRANNIYIVDDETANDEFSVMICKGLAPLRTEVHVLHVSEAVEVLKAADADDDNKALIIVKTPSPVIQLIEGGVRIEKVIVGGMGKRDDRKMFYKAIHTSSVEIEQFRKLIDMNVDLQCQIVPSDKPSPVAKLV